MFFPRGRLPVPWRARLISLRFMAIVMRVGLYLCCVALAAAGRGTNAQLGWFVAVGAVALAASAVPAGSRWRRPLAVAEAGVTALAVASTGGAESPLFPYLPAAGLGAGLALGVEGAALSSGSAATVLLLRRIDTPAGGGSLADFTSAAATWTVLNLALGLCGVLLRSQNDTDRSPDARYAEAYQLLDQLRAVTRSLPGSLDPGTVASVLIDRVREVVPTTRAAVLLHSGERFVPLALHGAHRVPWRPSTTEPGPVQTAWQRRSAVVERRPADTAGRRRASTLLVQPLLAGDRPVGLLIAEAEGETSFSEADVKRIATMAVEATPALETAALFDELRLSAATEERARLAREMHDGIAQDLAYLGYQVDAVALAIDRDQTDALEKARNLRTDITRLTSDLRLSISDLRSSIGPERGLGAALTTYARSASTHAGITVHVTLAEAAIRLMTDTEVSLLRIAHEAIGAARRRPGVRNLWVGLETDPPSFCLEIADDGQQPERLDDTRAAHTVRELATHIAAELTFAPRPGGGSSLRVRHQEETG